MMHTIKHHLKRKQCIAVVTPPNGPKSVLNSVIF